MPGLTVSIIRHGWARDESERRLDADPLARSWDDLPVAPDSTLLRLVRSTRQPSTELDCSNWLLMTPRPDRTLAIEP